MGRWVDSPARGKAGGQCSRPGFTIIEIVVCMGIIMVLIGLVLPQLASFRESAADARALATIRSDLTLVTLYTNDYGGVYPVASRSVNASVEHWNVPLKARGYVDAFWQTDPVGVRHHGACRFSMSAAMCYAPELMVPGQSVPLDYARTSAVRSADVAYPSQKGVLVQSLHFEQGGVIPWVWNPFDRPISPIAMADGSVMRARCTDFALKYDFFEHHWMGFPVVSTWDGCRGMDRLKR